MANPCEEDSMSTFRGRVEEYFRARPDQWIDGLAIAQVGGAYAGERKA